jgi:hypothetical protein
MHFNFFNFLFIFNSPDIHPISFPSRQRQFLTAGMCLCRCLDSADSTAKMSFIQHCPADCFNPLREMGSHPFLPLHLRDTFRAAPAPSTVCLRNVLHLFCSTLRRTAVAPALSAVRTPTRSCTSNRSAIAGGVFQSIRVPSGHSVAQPVRAHLIIGAASGGHRPITATSHATAPTAPSRAVGRTGIAVTMNGLESLRPRARSVALPLNSPAGHFRLRGRRLGRTISSRQIRPRRHLAFLCSIESIWIKSSGCIGKRL